MSGTTTSATAAATTATFMPMALVDQCIGSRLQVVMRNHQEIVGTLRGFDDYLNMVLDDAVEYLYVYSEGGREQRTTNAGSILLNGGNIAFLVPLGNPPDSNLYRKIVDEKKL